MQTDIAGKNVHVIGLGALGTGRAVARALSRRGARVTVSDAKPARLLEAEIEALHDVPAEILTGDDAYGGIEAADLVVPSPGVPLDIPPLLRAREHGVRVVSEIEVASWFAPCPIVAITGTKGKTTTTALLGEVLRDAGVPTLVGGNIGLPLIELADQAGANGLLIAEVSSFQLEAIESFRPRVAVLLNLFPDHLDRHQTMEAYTAAKARLFANQQPDDTAIINHDDPGAWALRAHTRARIVAFSTRAPEPTGADLADGRLRVAGENVCPLDAVRLRGKHNLSNALAALAAAHAVGARLDRAEETLRRFPGIEHRLEAVCSVGGVLFINDSQATTPPATIAALESLEGKIALIAGGRPKVHDWRALADAVAARNVTLHLIGEAAEEIAAAARNAGVRGIFRADSLQDAVRAAYRQVRPQGMVLLSPACASFDMFTDMAERGRIFKESVQALSRQEGGA